MAETALPAPEFACDCPLHITLNPPTYDTEYPDGAVMNLGQLRNLVTLAGRLQSDAPVQLFPDGLLVVHARNGHLIEGE